MAESLLEAGALRATRDLRSLRALKTRRGKRLGALGLGLAGEAVLTADQLAVAAALLADVTSADLALTLFTVMRAISPDLQPISFGHGLDRALTRTLAKRAVSLPEAWISPIW